MQDVGLKNKQLTSCEQISISCIQVRSLLFPGFGPSMGAHPSLSDIVLKPGSIIFHGDKKKPSLNTDS